VRLPLWLTKILFWLFPKHIETAMSLRCDRCGREIEVPIDASEQDVLQWVSAHDEWFHKGTEH
jgi:hypothetical protein